MDKECNSIGELRITKVEETKGVRQYRKYPKELKEEVCRLAESGKLTHKKLGDKFDRADANQQMAQCS